MNKLNQLPQPDKAAIAHSNKLSNIIKQAIKANNNQISFAKYMQMALYEPGLGYYVAGSHKFGEHGDFVTAPEISDLFGKSIANQYISTVIPAKCEAREPGSISILEFGSGSGKLCFDLLSELNIQNRLPNKYYILEVSPDLVQRQQNLLKKLPENIYKNIIWLNKLPEQKINAFVIANEVLDAMPVNIFTIDENNKPLENYVSLDQDDNFVFNKNKPNNNLEKYFNKNLKIILEKNKDYISECNLNINYWLKDIINFLASGTVLLIDYGYNREQYYHRDRGMGTLMCHYRHLAHHDPFLYPGLQDITAHVDFDCILDFVAENNLKVDFFGNQADFLLQNNITKFLEQTEPTSQQYLKYSQELKKLIFPHEMGEIFKVCMFSV